MSDKYATELLPASLRVRRWNEFGSKTYSPISVRPYDPGNFRAQLSRAVVGNMGITCMQTTPAFAVLRGVKTGGWAVGNSGACLLTLQKRGRTRLRQAGREVVLQPGDVVLRDLRKDWEMDASENMALISFKISIERIVSTLGDPGPLLAVPLRCTALRSSLLSSVLEEVSKLAFQSTSGCGLDAVEDVVLDAAKVAYGGSAELIGSSSHDERLWMEIDRLVECHLEDPAFTVAELASSLGISMRSLQRAFLVRATTARTYILIKRLELAAGRLRDSRVTTRVNITDVALSSGFNDPGYFSRVFSQHFGITPSEFVGLNR